MRWLVGVDGGGTKSAIALYCIESNLLKIIRTHSISPQDYGINKFTEILDNAIYGQIDKNNDEIVSICIGVPGFGEIDTIDESVLKSCKELFSKAKVICVNDCVVGHAGALKLDSGINIVAGTGAIAYGRDEHGNNVRSNGWDNEFSDEGSCCWLGRKTIELFCKQADGRCTKGPLYQEIKNTLALKHDFDIIKVYSKDYRNQRRKIAELQNILYVAAVNGDISAKEAYINAARELALSIYAVYSQLQFENNLTISFSGGLFLAKETILDPLKSEIDKLITNYKLLPPVFNPHEGALLLAAENADFNIEQIYKKFINGGKYD